MTTLMHRSCLARNALFFEIGKGGDRLLHWQAGTGIDLRGRRFDRRRADLGLLHVADHLDGRGDHPQLRRAQRLVEAHGVKRRLRDREATGVDRFQAAVEAFELTPLRSATVLSLVFAAFSSFRLVVRKRTISSWPSSSAHAISVP